MSKINMEVLHFISVAKLVPGMASFYSSYDEQMKLNRWHSRSPFGHCIEQSISIFIFVIKEQYRSCWYYQFSGFWDFYMYSWNSTCARILKSRLIVWRNGVSPYLSLSVPSIPLTSILSNVQEYLFLKLLLPVAVSHLSYLVNMLNLLLKLWSFLLAAAAQLSYLENVRKPPAKMNSHWKPQPCQKSI